MLQFRTRFTLLTLFVLLSGQLFSCKDKTQPCSSYELILSVADSVPVGQEFEMQVTGSDLPEGTKLYLDNNWMRTQVSSTTVVHPALLTLDPIIYSVVADIEGCGIISSNQVEVKPYLPNVNCLTEPVIANVEGLDTFQGPVNMVFSGSMNTRTYTYTFSGNTGSMEVKANAGSDGLYEVRNSLNNNSSYSTALTFNYRKGSVNAVYKSTSGQPADNWMLISSGQGGTRVAACKTQFYRYTGTGPDTIRVSFNLKK